ncbi:hypothetical protein [Nocardioides pantholopis]|uniref:hypothetical protein n=1 Tax=Nocardioides pantholopis TaxID=2483798 RepID=UPI000F0900EA|nr:hypothetical protein [Nocardioides pantholopis]
MSPRTDSWRRAVTLALVATLLVLVPAVASARFGSSDADGLRVGTATMVAPAGVTGTYKCGVSGLVTETLDIEVDGFTDAGPAGATYQYTLRSRGATLHSRTSASKEQELEGRQTNDVIATQWELDVVAKVGNWTSPPATVTIDCPWTGITLRRIAF